MVPKRGREVVRTAPSTGAVPWGLVRALPALCMLRPPQVA